MFVATLLVVSVGYAAGINVTAPQGLGAGEIDVDTPPIVLGEINWVVEWENSEYRVRVVEVPVYSTGGTLNLVFRMTLTKDGVSLGEKIVVTSVDEFPGNTIGFNFNGLDVPVSDVNDLHLMVCDNDGSLPNNRCFKVP
jgi:hypothetical protein